MTDPHFVFDENVSHYYVALLKQLGVNCSHITEHQSAGTKDPVILSMIAENDWVLISGDPTMMKAHAKIFAEMKIRVLFMPNLFVNKDGWFQSAWIFKHWQIVEKEFRQAKGLQQGRIRDNGKIEVLK